MYDPGPRSLCLPCVVVPNVRGAVLCPLQESPSREEEELLFATLEGLFGPSAPNFDAQALLALTRALLALSRAKLTELQTTGPVRDIRAQYLFGLTKLIQILRANLARLPSLWEPIASHVLTLACNHKNPDVRSYGSRELCGVVEEALAALTSEPYASLPATDGHLQALYDMQTAYFEAMEAMCRSVRGEVRAEALESVYRLLQHSGQSLSAAWVIVLPILMAVGLDSTDSQFIPLAFKSLQLIVADYLPTLPVGTLPPTPAPLASPSVHF